MSDQKWADGEVPLTISGEPGKIITASGKSFAPLAPDISLIDPEDIAHHLGNLCRYTGATKRFYSVGEHSVRCWLLAQEYTDDLNDLRWVLLHDSPEYVINDIARPLKQLEAYDAYRYAEGKLMEAIAERFGLIYPEPDIVKQVDHILFATEARDLMPPTDNFAEWSEGIVPLDQVIFPWTPMESKIQFLYAMQAVGLYDPPAFHPWKK